MPKLRQPPPTRLMFWWAFWVFLIDQATKWWVIHWLGLEEGDQREVWPPVLNLVMTRNRGMNFGLFAEMEMRWALVVLALGISGFVIWWVLREGGGRRVYVSAGLLIGGALGNVIDRLLDEEGGVADFLNFPFFGHAVGWILEAIRGMWGSGDVLSAERLVPQYSLNIADIAIFLGALGLVLFAGRGKGPAAREKPAKPVKPVKTG